MVDFALSHPAFNTYQIDATYDEMLAGNGAPRPQYTGLYRQLTELPADELRSRQQAADLSFLNQGITFTVYGQEEGTERIFPYDLVPRVLTDAEWQTIERGLTQRILVLNLFLPGCARPV
jgi:uncharacterized circularly permuted ATP-grasp superfamily protein